MAFLRASDALHLACAAENQFSEVYSGDQMFPQAAPHLVDWHKRILKPSRDRNFSTQNGERVRWEFV